MGPTSTALETRLDEHAKRFPLKPALIVRRGARWETTTYAQLNDLASELALGIGAADLQHGTKVAIVMPPGVRFFALAFALLRVGLVPVLIDPAIGLREFRRCLEEAEPKILIGSGLPFHVLGILGWGNASVAHRIDFDALHRKGQELAGCGRSTTSLPPAPGDAAPAAIIYTSGSTGPPKGAIYSRGNIAAQIDSISQATRIQPDDVDLPAFPIFALIDCVMGITAVVPEPRFPQPSRVDPKRILEAIRVWRVTNLFASPVLLARLADHAASRGSALSGLRRVVTAGAPVSPRVLERCLGLLPQDAGVLCVYGATEALATALIDGREIVGETAALSARGAGICVGRPIEGTAVRIITVTDEPISEWSDRFLAVDGEVGEITVEGLGVTERYVGHQDINEAAKIRAGVGVLHRTGDLGYLDARGRLWFCGRKSHCVQTSKGRLFPEQVEGVFNPHPLVERTALVEVDGDPVLWIELKARARWADKRKLVQELRRLGETHAGAAAIRGFLFLPRFPTDVRHNSKILRERLAALAARRSISERW